MRKESLFGEYRSLLKKSPTKETYIFQRALLLRAMASKTTSMILHVRVLCTANPTWGDISESSKLKARTSLLPHSVKRDVRALSFEL